MNVTILFLIVLIASFISVRIGAIAFQFTGLEWSLAKFQALSCFSGTGFTTKESELITANPTRRKIASFLMVLGNAGFVTMIATVVRALQPQEAIWQRMTKSFLPIPVSSQLVPWVNIIVIIIILFVVYKVFTSKGIGGRITHILRKLVFQKKESKSVSYEELLFVTGGHGIGKIRVSEGSPVLNKSLADSRLKQHNITVLAIIRKGQSIVNPSADVKIMLGDEFIAFGRLDTMKDSICGAAW